MKKLWLRSASALSLAFGIICLGDAIAQQVHLSPSVQFHTNLGQLLEDEGYPQPVPLLNWRHDLGSPAVLAFDAANTYQNVGMVLMVNADSFLIEGSCSGTLINQRTVMSAAHCVRDNSLTPNDDRVITLVSFSPDATNDFFVTGDYHRGTSHVTPAGYDRFDFSNDNDITLISLSRPVFDIPYAVLANSVLGGNVTIVGYGGYGTGLVPFPGSGLFDNRRRIATNQVEAYGFLDFTSETPVVLADFEDPTDPLGTDFWGDPTVTAQEATVAPGDSGGPLFDSLGRVVGIASGAFTFDFGYGTIPFWTSVPDQLSYINANNPLRSALDNLGAGAWENPGHWINGVVPDNTTHEGDNPFLIADYTVAQHYYNVTLSGGGVTTLSSAVEVDKVDIFAAGTELDITAAGDLDVWSDVGVFANSTLRVNGILSIIYNTEYSVFLSGGTLRGDGTINANVDNFAGTVAPGNSIDTLNINGNYTQGVAGLLQIELSNTASDVLAISGDATLDGAVEFSVFGAPPTLGQTRTFMTTGGTVSGQFATVVDFIPGDLMPLVTYGSNFVRVTIGNFCTGVAGSISSPVCTALLDPVLTGDPDMAGPLVGLQQLASTDAALYVDALEALNPTRSHAQAVVGLSAGDLIRNQFGRRTHDVFGTSSAENGTAQNQLARSQLASATPSAEMLASAATAALASTPSKGNVKLPNGHGLFIAADGAMTDTDQAGGIGIDNAEVTALTAGIDRNDENFVYGAALSYLQSHTDQEYGLGGNTTSDGFAASGYGSMREGNLYIDAYASYAWHEFETERLLLVAPLTFATAIGETEATQVQAGATVGYSLYRNPRTTIGAVGGLYYVGMDIDGYTETGAGALSAVLPDRSIDSLRAQFGGELAFQATTGRDALVPMLRVVWNHEFEDQALVTTAGFAGAPAVTFASPGPTLDSDWATIGVGLSGRVSDGTAFYFRYQVDIGRTGQDNQEISAAARVAF